MNITDPYILGCVDIVLDAAGGHRPPLSPERYPFMSCEDTVNRIARHLTMWAIEAKADGDTRTVEMLDDTIAHLKGTDR